VPPSPAETGYQKGYGYTLHTMLCTQGLDGLCSPSIRPPAALLLFMTHSDLDVSEHSGCEDRRDAAQAEKRGFVSTGLMNGSWTH
jgi:hypothetical protein